MPTFDINGSILTAIGATPHDRGRISLIPSKPIALGDDVGLVHLERDFPGNTTFTGLPVVTDPGFYWTVHIEPLGRAKFRKVTFDFQHQSTTAISWATLIGSNFDPLREYTPIRIQETVQAMRGQPDGLAGLDAGGKIQEPNLPERLTPTALSATIASEVDTGLDSRIASMEPVADAAAAAVDAALVAGGQKQLALDKAALVVDAEMVRNDHPNPGAEYDTGGVTGSSASVTVTRDNTGWKASGAYAWLITYNTATTAAYAWADRFAVVAGQPVAACGTFRNESAGAKVLRLMFRWVDAADALVSSEYTAVEVPAGETAQIVCVGKAAPAGATGLRVCFQRFSGASGNLAGDVFRVDDIFVGVGQYRVPAELPLDGDLPNAYWLGTPGASASLAARSFDPLPEHTAPDLLATWGDSLSSTWENAASGVPVSLSGRWPTYLAALCGLKHYAGGVSGDGDKGIAARMGAVPMLIDEVTIAATGATVITPLQNVWKDNADGAGYLTDATGNRVLGYLDWSGSAWTFTRAVPGSAVPLTGPRIQFEPVGPNGIVSPGVVNEQLPRTAITTIESRNVYYYLGSYTQAEAIDLVLSRYRSMVDHAVNSTRSPRVLVMEIPPSYNSAAPGTDDEAPGTDRRAFMDALNAALKAEFRPYWCPYVTEWLLTEASATEVGHTFTAQDLTDIGNGVVPTAYRQDSIHYSDLGGQAIAAYLFQWMQRRGWVA